MKIHLVFILLSTILLSCCSKNIVKISWEEKIIDRMEDVDYLYWNDGNQFVTEYKDSLKIDVAGFEYDNSIYILLSITNEKDHPVTFFYKNCELTYSFNKREIKLLPVKPKNFDKGHFSLFNSILDGASNISSVLLSVPVGALFSGNKEESDSPNKIVEEYHDEKKYMSKKIFMNNHTLFPEMNYTGFLVFEYDEDESLGKQKFTLSVDLGPDFTVTGFLTE